jgi:hypothetical protein
MRRILSIVAICALPASAVAIGFSGTASAAQKATPEVTCKKLSWNIGGGNGTLTKCSDPANTGKKGTFPVSALTSGSGTITWAGTGTTKVTGVTGTPNGGTLCAAGSTEYAVSGTTGASTGKAKDSIKKKEPIAALVCVDGSGNFTMAPTSSFTIG